MSDDPVHSPALYRRVLLKLGEEKSRRFHADESVTGITEGQKSSVRCVIWP